MLNRLLVYRTPVAYKSPEWTYYHTVQPLAQNSITTAHKTFELVFGPREMRMGSGEGSTIRNFIVCTVRLIVRVIKSRRLRWGGHVGGR